MKKVISLFLFLLFSELGFSSYYHVKVAVGTTMCINCYGELLKLNELPAKVDLEFVSSTDNKEYISEFLKGYEFNRPYKVVEGNVKDNSVVWCQFYNSDSMMVEFDLNNFDIYIDKIRSEVSTFHVSDSITLNCDLGPRASVALNDNKYVLYDYLTGKVVVVDYVNRNVKKISSEQIPINTFLSMSKCDTALYHKYKGSLKKMNLSGVHIESVSSDNDSLYFILTIKVFAKNKKSIAATPVYFSASFKNGEFHNVKVIDTKVELKDDKYITIGKMFKYKKYYYLQLYKSSLGDENYYLSEYIDGKDSLKYCEVLSPQLPKCMINEYPYTFVNLGYHSNYCFLDFYPNIYYLDSKTLFDYSNLLDIDFDFNKKLTLKTSFSIVDLHIESNILSVLFLYKNDLFLAKIDVLKNVLLSQKKQYFPDFTNKYLLRFLSSYEFIGLSKNRKTVYFFQ